ncbi:hypothetical protein LJB98_00100 [Bacteroidales bacterium OttesenSCG-928-M11]|nr:hypothetical protein [Bacteroidales bacterium OttesenSCG-928-M11]
MDAVAWKQIISLGAVVILMYFALRIMKKVQDPPKEQEEWEDEVESENEFEKDETEEELKENKE